MQLEVQEIKALEPVKFNYEDIKNWLTAKAKEYKDVVYTVETITLAKQDRATLNKVSSAINDEKKRIKNELLKPYVDFETKCKELMAIVDDASKTIDTQIKAFETEADNKKKEEIKAIYDAYIGDYKELIPFEKIFNDRWLNKTYTMKKITEDINHIVVKTSDDMSVLEGQLKDENILNQVKSYYFMNINESDVLSKSLAQGMKIDENNKKLEELKAQQEATKNIAIYTPVDNKKEQQVEMLTIDFRVTATKEQFVELRQFFEKNNINYGRI